VTFLCSFTESLSERFSSPSTSNNDDEGINTTVSPARTLWIMHEGSLGSDEPRKFADELPRSNGLLRPHPPTFAVGVENLQGGVDPLRHPRAPLIRAGGVLVHQSPSAIQPPVVVVRQLIRLGVVGGPLAVGPHPDFVQVFEFLNRAQGSG
jgi:hypothetical protein